MITDPQILSERWRELLRLSREEFNTRAEDLRNLVREMVEAGSVLREGPLRNNLAREARTVALRLAELTNATPPAFELKPFEQEFKIQIQTNHLPPPAYLFVGRESEIKWLDDRVADPECRIAQVTGTGGGGKTATVVEWLRAIKQKEARSRIQAIYADSFYSFPAHAFRRAPAFLDDAHKFFTKDLPLEGGFSRADLTKELAWAIGCGPNRSPDLVPPRRFDHEHVLADLGSRGLRILILDGFEGCLHLKNGRWVFRQKRMRSEPSIEDFLHEFLKLDSGICIVTTRYTPQLFRDARLGRKFQELRLGGLTPEGGESLLKQLVNGHGIEIPLKSISERFSGHPLTLLLVGNWLHTNANSNPFLLERFLLSNFEDLGAPQDLNDNEAWERQTRDRAKTASRSEDLAEYRLAGVLRSYMRYTEQAAEDFKSGALLIEIIRMTAFFQGSITISELATLLEIKDDAFKDINHYLRVELLKEDQEFASLDDLGNLVEELDAYRLFQIEKPDSSERATWKIDVHPIVRSFFRRELGQKFKRAWKLGHNTIARYFRKEAGLDEDQAGVDAPKLDREDLLNLFKAVEHACQGKDWKLAYLTYWRDIHRNLDALEDNYLWAAWEEYGLQTFDISTLSWFFASPRKDGQNLWSKFESNFERASKEVAEMRNARVHIRTAAGLCLLHLGFVNEAETPMLSAYQTASSTLDLLTAAILAGLLGERAVLKGQLKADDRAEEWLVTKALTHAEHLMASAQSEGDRRVAIHQLRSKWSKIGNLYAHRGDWDDARHAFEEMLQYHQQARGEGMFSTTRSGYHYVSYVATCANIVNAGWAGPNELSLDENPMSVLRQMRLQLENWLESAMPISPQDRALNHLSLARCYHIESSVEPVEGKKALLDKANQSIDKSILLMKEHLYRNDLPRSYVEKARILISLYQFSLSDKLLDEAEGLLDEAEVLAWEGESELYVCDAALTSCELNLTRYEASGQLLTYLLTAEEDHDTASRTISETGYQRRNFQLMAIQKRLEEAKEQSAS